MNNDVKTEILPLSETDLKKIRKTASQTLLILPLVLAFFGFIFYQFTRSSKEQMDVFIYFFFAFFVLVIGIILFNIFQTLASKEKIVQEGYITNKRVHIKSTTTSTHNSRSSKNTSKYYYICIGSEEISLGINFYNQVKKGDFVKIEKTIKNKEVFNIEILKSGLDEKGIDLKIAPQKTAFAREKDKNIIRKAFFKAMLFQFAIGAVSFYVFSLIITLVVMFILNKNLSLEQLIYPIYFIRFVFVAFFILLNIKTYYLFLDMRSGEITTSTEKILDVFFKGYSGSGASMHSDAYHVLATNGFSFTVDQEMGKALQSGDLMQICFSPKARLILEAKKADIY